MRTIMLLFLLAGLSFSGCNNPCKDVICGTHGTCNEGSCTCDTGYEHDLQGQCDAEVREKFIGNYKVTDVCSTHQDLYFSDVLASSVGIEKILIENIYGFSNNTITAMVDGTSLSIAAQTTTDNFEIEGSGSIDNDVITINYVISNTGSSISDSCTMSMVRQ